MLFSGDNATDEEEAPVGIMTHSSFHRVPNSLGHFLSSPKATEAIDAGASALGYAPLIQMYRDLRF